MTVTCAGLPRKRTEVWTVACAVLPSRTTSSGDGGVASDEVLNTYITKMALKKLYGASNGQKIDFLKVERK